MKKSKLFKKSLSVILAGATLFQACLVPHEVHAEQPKTATSVKVLGSIGGVAILGLTITTIVEAIQNDNLEFEYRKQARRLNYLENYLREYNNDHPKNIDENSEQMNLLLREIAKDWKEMFRTRFSTEYLQYLNELKSCHFNRDFTDEDIVTILRATMRYKSELKSYNCDNWLTDCEFLSGDFKDFRVYNLYPDYFDTTDTTIPKNLRIDACRRDLSIILSALRYWEYHNRVSYCIEKNRLLDFVCKIL